MRQEIRQKWKHDVLRRIQLGLIFGLVACFTFFCVQTVGGERDLKKIRRK